MCINNINIDINHNSKKLKSYYEMNMAIFQKKIQLRKLLQVN